MQYVHVISLANPFSLVYKNERKKTLRAMGSAEKRNERMRIVLRTSSRRDNRERSMLADLLTICESPIKSGEKRRVVFLCSADVGPAISWHRLYGVSELILSKVVLIDARCACPRCTAMFKIRSCLKPRTNLSTHAAKRPLIQASQPIVFPLVCATSVIFLASLAKPVMSPSWTRSWRLVDRYYVAKCRSRDGVYCKAVDMPLGLLGCSLINFLCDLIHFSG